MSSADFANFLRNFIDYAKEELEDIYTYILNGKTPREATFEMTKLLRQTIVLELDEIDSCYLNDKEKLLDFIEELYDFWKNHQRFSIVNAGKGMAIQESSFVAADSAFNSLIRSLYRTVEEKVLGRKNSVYRQMQAGTNAAIAIRENVTKLSDTYEALKDIPFIDSIMLRTPMILHPKSNKRTGMFTERDTNPISEFTGNRHEWFFIGVYLFSSRFYFIRSFIGKLI